MNKIFTLSATCALAAFIGVAAPTRTEAFGLDDLGFDAGGKRVCFTASCATKAVKEPRVRKVERRSRSVDHRQNADRPKNVRKRTRVHVQNRFECQYGTDYLLKLGYSSIDPFDCTGREYQYSALRGTVLYRAKLNAMSGRLNVELVGPAN
ncbi:MAG: hypothetical protein AB7U75_21875 [Hyphomicrobiaceae bacterium]